MDIATQMILFAAVVENGGFSAAARDLGLTPSAVSRQIGQLEDRLGTRLLNRSTRRISLTEVGRAFYSRCSEVAQNVQEAENLVINMVDHPQGTLKVAATVAFAKAQLLPLLPAFLAENPDLKISLDATDRVIDLVEEQVDVAIRFSEQIDDSSAVSRKLATNRRVYVASPAYIGPAMRKYGNIFRAHDCPNDAQSNLTRTIDLRLLSGNTAVRAGGGRQVERCRRRR